MIRRTPLKRGTKPLKRTPLRKVSKKRAKEGRIYSEKRKAFLERWPWCQVWMSENGFKQPYPESEGDSFAPMVKAEMFEIKVCPRSCDIHHKAKRTGSNYLNESTWLAVSREMHEKIHQNPSWARAQGYLV